MTINFLESASVSLPLWMFIIVLILAVLPGAVLGFYYGFHLAYTNPYYFDDHKEEDNGTPADEQDEQDEEVSH